MTPWRYHSPESCGAERAADSTQGCRRWGFGLRGALLLALALGGARAADCPPVSEALVQLKVGDEIRDDVTALITASGILLSEDALSPDEAPYVAERVQCASGVFVRLLPAVPLSFSPNAQQVILSPVPSLLGTRVYDLSRGTLSVSRDLPLFRIDYDLSGQLTPSSAEGRASVTAAVQFERATAEVNLQGGYSDEGEDQAAPRLSARAAYPLLPDLKAEVLFQGSSSYARTGGSFSGLRAAYRRVQTPQLERLELELPTRNTLEVYDNGFLIGSVPAPAGRVVLTHIPLRSRKGEVVVRAVRGTLRELARQPYDLDRVGLKNEATQGQLELGWLDGRLFAAGGLSLPLNEALALEGETLAQQDGSLSLSLGLKAHQGDFTAQGKVGARLEQDGVLRSDVRTELGYSRDDFGVNAQISAPIERFEDFQLGLTSSLNRSGVSVASGLTYQYRKWGASLSVLYTLSPQIRFQNSLSVSPEGGRFGVRAVIQLSPADQLTLQGSTQPSLSYTRGLDEQNSVRLSSDFQGAQVEAFHRSGVSGYFLGNTDGYAYANLRGSLNLVGGQFAAGASSSGSVLLVSSGIPNLRIYLNNQLQGSTDASGRLLLRGLVRDLPQIVRFEIDDLPLEVQVKQRDFVVRIVEDGVFELDLRDQFAVSKFLGLRGRNGQAASEGRLVVRGRTYLLDADGYGFVEGLEQDTPARLIVNDEECAVTLRPALEEATCDP